MGLTVHYELKLKPGHDALAAVQGVRQLALDLPFESVGDVVDLQGDDCDFEKRHAAYQTKGEEDPFRWLCIQAGEYLTLPWNKHMQVRVNPTRIVAFEVEVGRGSEWANFGLCQYPDSVTLTWKPQDDTRFHKRNDPKATHRAYNVFEWERFQRWRKKHDNGMASPVFYQEERQVPTKLAGWSWGSFCKTQYASSPECGGVPNFLRCHISLITLLDLAKKVPGLRVSVRDEGDYGPHHSCPDWREADAEGRKRVYRRMPGHYSPALLAKEVGGWNEMIAATFGALNAAYAKLGGSVAAPIRDYADFERLEFRGSKSKDLAPFLAALAAATPETT